MDKKLLKILSVLSVLLGISLAVVSFFGAFVPAIYERDAASMAAQGMGQDLVDLFLVVPVFLISLVLFRRGSRLAAFVYGGTLFYILYSFFIYAFGVHFNSLFLFYCLILGLSLYSFVLFMLRMNRLEVESWFGTGRPVRFMGIYLIIVAAMFYLLWLKDVVPSILAGTVPKTVSDNNLLVNPVHVLDLAIALPGLAIAAVLLMRKRRLGYILAPVSLVFVVILAIALVGMVVMLKVKGISEDISIAAIFIILALVSTVLLWLFMRKMKVE
jgi:hypothetical protein